METVINLRDEDARTVRLGQGTLCCNVGYETWLGTLKLPYLRCLSPSVKYFTDRSKAVNPLWIFYVFFYLVFVMHLCASVYLCLVVTCWERADLLALVCGV